MSRVEIIRDAIIFGMGWAESEGAVDDSTERDEALAALDELVTEHHRLRGALEKIAATDGGEWYARSVARAALDYAREEVA